MSTQTDIMNVRPGDSFTFENGRTVEVWATSTLSSLGQRYVVLTWKSGAGFDSAQVKA